MARYRFKRRSSGNRSFFSRRSRGRSSNSGLSEGKLLMGGLAYGFVRPYASEYASKLLPGALGQLGDEVVLGGIAYLFRKKSKGIVRDVLTAALAVESARIGEQLSMKATTQTQVQYI